MEKKGGNAIKCMDMVLLEEGNVSGFGIFPLTAGYETLAFWSLFSSSLFTNRVGRVFWQSHGGKANGCIRCVTAFFV